MPDLEPITREETLLDGGDFTPITRKEMFIKRIYDKTQSVPEPITREEYFLAKAGEGSGGDVTIEQLNVTENGTYSESGKAYSPVIVDVPTPPVPENAYLLNNLSGLPADIASFNDGTDLPMASLKVSVTPYQDLHGYDGPWVGGAGKNKAKISYTTQTVSGVTITVNSDGAFSTSGTATEDKTIVIGTYDGVSGTEYILTGCPSGGGVSTYRLYASAIGSDTGTGAWGTYSSGGVNVALQFFAGTNMNGLTFKPMVRLSSVSDATFAPYSNICPISGWDEAVVTVADDAESPTTSHEYTIDLDGTRYGATLDVVSGELVVDRAYVDLGSLSWSVISAQNGVFGATVNGLKTYSYGNTPDMLCSVYKITPSSYNDPYVSANGIIWTYVGLSVIRIKDTAYSDATAFKTAINGVQLVYELATPITVQLAPTPVKSLEGENNISANCGNIIEVEYFSKEV